MPGRLHRISRPLALAAAFVGLLGSSARAEPARRARTWEMAGQSWRLVGRVSTASMPWSVTVSPDGGSLYVAHVGVGKRHRDNVWRYDARTLEVEARSVFRGHAVEAVFTRDGRRLFVTNSRVDQLLELDPLDLSVLARWQPGRVPKDLRLSPDERTAVVANWQSGDVSLVDVTRPGAEAERIATGRFTRGVELSADGTRAYAMAFGAGRVAVVDMIQRRVSQRQLARCRNPRHAVLANESTLLVTCNGDRAVLVIDLVQGRVKRRLRVGGGPKTIAVSPSSSLAVVANEASGSLSAIDLRSWAVDTLSMPGRKPCGVAFSPDGDRLYVTLRGSHELLAFARVRDAATLDQGSVEREPR